MAKTRETDDGWLPIIVDPSGEETPVGKACKTEEEALKVAEAKQWEFNQKLQEEIE